MSVSVRKAVPAGAHAIAQIWHVQISANVEMNVRTGQKFHQLMKTQMIVMMIFNSLYHNTRICIKHVLVINIYVLNLNKAGIITYSNSFSAVIWASGITRLRLIVITVMIIIF